MCVCHVLIKSYLLTYLLIFLRPTCTAACRASMTDKTASTLDCPTSTPCIQPWAVHAGCMPTLNTPWMNVRIHGVFYRRFQYEIVRFTIMFIFRAHSDPLFYEIRVHLLGFKASSSTTSIFSLMPAAAVLPVCTVSVLHGSASRYLGPLTRVADVPGRRNLRSAATNRLIVPSVKLSTVGSRAFPAAASSIWNSLPEYIVNASTLQSFQHHLKTFLFRRSFPDILL